MVSKMCFISAIKILAIFYNVQVGLDNLYISLSLSLFSCIYLSFFVPLFLFFCSFQYLPISSSNSQCLLCIFNVSLLCWSSFSVTLFSSLSFIHFISSYFSLSLFLLLSLSSLKFSLNFQCLLCLYNFSLLSLSSFSISLFRCPFLSSWPILFFHSLFSPLFPSLLYKISISSQNWSVHLTQSQLSLHFFINIFLLLIHSWLFIRLCNGLIWWW